MSTKMVMSPELGRCQALVDKFKRKQCMIISTDEFGETTIAFFGKTKKDKFEAGKSANVIKSILGITDKKNGKKKLK